MTDIAGIDVARIEIHLPEAFVRIQAGSTLENPITLVNLTPLPDFFYLAVSGIPAPWASLDKESVNLFPNWSDVINLTFAVPVGTRPGNYPLEIQASSRTQENVNTSIKLELVVEGETSGQTVAPPPGVIAGPENSFQGGHPEVAPTNFPPAGSPSFIPTQDFPRLQFDLEFGQLVVPCGQTIEQIAHLLNLDPNPQNFSLGMEGLPPEWISVQPPVLHLSPNWSEAAHLRIAVPVDGIPGRYLIGVRAVPEIYPQAVIWNQFDIVILPPVSPASSVSPFEPESVHQDEVVQQVVTPQNAPAARQPENLPFAPQVGPVTPQPSVWNQPVTPTPAPVQEAPKAEPKQRTGLFGWKKKKAEPVQPEPILFVPIAPVEIRPAAPVENAEMPGGSVQPQPETPALPASETAASLAAVEPGIVPVEQPGPENGPANQFSPAQPQPIINPGTLLPGDEHPQPETIQPLVAGSVLVPPATTETVLVPTPVTSTEPENNIAVPGITEAEPTVGPVELSSTEEINSPIDEVITKVPSKFWWDAPAPATNEKFEDLPASEENPAITGQESTVQPVVPELLASEAEQAPAIAVEQAEVVEGPALEPAFIKTDNLELSVENVKIRFELGTNEEQQIGLVNLMSNPAYFDIKIEGLPENWYGFSYSQINLFPNWREQVYLRVEAPLDTVPGTYPAALVVTLSNLPEDKVEVPFEVEVLPSAVLADKLYRATGTGLPVKLSADAKINLILDTANLTLIPGESLAQTVTLVNQTPVLDLFELKLEGLLESWYQFSTPNINLFPNWKEDFYLRVSLPKNAVPGLYPIRLLVKGRSNSDLHTEQSLLLQVLPPPPKPVVVEEPIPESEAEVNPALDDVDTVNPVLSGITASEPAQVDEPETEQEEADDAPAQPFSFASFFQQQNLVPGAVAQNPTPPAPTLPVVPPAPEATYNQATSSIPAPGAAPSINNVPANYVPASSYGDQPGDPFGKHSTTKMGQQTPGVLAPQTSLAGIIPVITAQPEAPAPAPIQQEEPVVPVAAPHKRTFLQRVTGKGKEQPAPVTPRIDENVLWRSAPSQAPGQTQSAAYPSEPVSSQATQVNRKNAAGNQAIPASGNPPIGGPGQPAQAGQRAYSPMSTGGEVARIQITLEKPHMTIVAGDSATQQIFLMNMTSLPDNFELTIEGLPGNWFSFENSTVNLFPNWNEHTTLTLNISDKVKPDLYKGRIVVAATAQTGVRAIMPIEIQVLAPLVVQARLQPHRGKGFKANYEMLLRNRSMSEGLMTMQWAPSNEYSVGSFNPPTVVLAPGQSQPVKLQVMLRKKTPSDQARQAQPFRVLVQPQWTVAQTPVVTAPVSVEGEYIHRSRWVFIQRHPVLVAFLTIILVIVLLWNLLLLPFIQNTLMSLTLDKLSYTDVATKPLSADQLSFNTRLKDSNPLGALVPTDVSFVEDPAKHPKGVVTIKMQAFVFTATLTGTLQVDPVSGDLQFVADNKNQPGSFPWFFMPPDKVMQKLSGKLKTWLKEQNPPQRLDDVYIEGNTLFLKLRNCQAGEVACK